jgi:uncharacterized coiled-coil protein SlyX
MRKQAIMWSCAALLVLASGSQAQEKQPFIGVLLDGTALPELLTKHLQLAPGQGLRVVNVSVDSTADKAGLERDDIIIAFQGQPLTDLDAFIEEVKQAGVGAKVSLEVIHLGQRKTVDLELKPMDKMDWKYPPEPEVVEAVRPGKIFKRGPDGQGWMVVPWEEMPQLNLDVEDFFKEKYTYGYSMNEEEFTVTIEGSPTEEDTKVVVRAGEKEYGTTVGGIDTLPEEYRGSARQAVESAKKDFRFAGKFRRPAEPPRSDLYKRYFETIPRPDMDRLSEQKDRALEKLQEQMDRLQQRMQQLEDHQREMLDKLLNRKDQAAPDPTGQATRPRPQDGESI